MAAMGTLSVAAVLVAALALLFLHKRRRAEAAQKQQQQLPPRHAVQQKPEPAVPQLASSDGSPVVEVAARSASLPPIPSAPKIISLQLSRSMPATVSPFATAAAALLRQALAPEALPDQALRPGQPPDVAALNEQPQRHDQHSPFATGAGQPSQPKQLSPFASAASVLATSLSDASVDMQQLLGSGSAELARRPSPPHLSAVLDALPIFASATGTATPAQTVAAAPSPVPPAAAPSPSLLARSPGGRHAPAHTPSPDRITLDQLRSEILGSDPLSSSEAQLESLLSTGLPAAGAATAAGTSEDTQQPVGGVPSATLPPSTGGGHDRDWEIAPNELEICKRPDGSLWQLGAGGFGRVYKAMRFGCTPVAVKVMAPTGDPTPGLYEDFKREARLLQRCMDPHVVSFLGASLNSDFTILVTEYCEGGSLSANLAAGKISWYRRGKQVALDVARGLVFLHRRGIVHFDLKSPNILLDRRGTAKIADLGLAKIMHHERSWVSGNLGTLNWAAPELLLGQPCSSSADIFSICTGAVPVRGRMRPLAVPDDCPAEVACLVEECMSVDPQARPSAQQLVERLQVAATSPPQRAAAAAHAGARRSMKAGQPAGHGAAAALFAHRASNLGSRIGSAEELAAPASLSAPIGCPARPYSETNLPALAACQAPPAATHTVHAPQPALQPALPAVHEDAEQQERQQAKLAQQAQQAMRTPSPRPTSPLPSALTVAGDSAVMAPAGQVATAVVAAQHMERGTSLPGPQWGDQYGLGYC